MNRDKTDIFLMIGTIAVSIVGAIIAGVRNERVIDRSVERYQKKKEKEDQKKLEAEKES